MTSLDYGPVDTIPRGALRTIAEYDARFDALLGFGYSWIKPFRTRRS